MYGVVEELMNLCYHPEMKHVREEAKQDPYINMTIEYFIHNILGRIGRFAGASLISLLMVCLVIWKPKKRDTLVHFLFRIIL